jgi:hypothetical protein
VLYTLTGNQNKINYVQYIQASFSPGFAQQIIPCLLGTTAVLVKSSQVKSSYFKTDGQSVCLGVEPNLGLLTRDIFFLKVRVLSYLGRPL